MSTMVYEITRHGVFVKTHLLAPTDDDWRKQLDFFRKHRAEIRYVVVTGQEGSGPTSRQRQELASMLTESSASIPTVALLNSRLSRGILTALTWMTRRDMRAYAPNDLDDALEWLGLSDTAKAEVRVVLNQQSQIARSA